MVKTFLRYPTIAVCLPRICTSSLWFHYLSAVLSVEFVPSFGLNISAKNFILSICLLSLASSFSLLNLSMNSCILACFLGDPCMVDVFKYFIILALHKISGSTLSSSAAICDNCSSKGTSSRVLPVREL